MTSDDCSSNIHEFCNPCECPCHGLNFSAEELITIYKLLEFQYVPYDNLNGLEIVRKLRKIIEEYENQ